MGRLASDADAKGPACMALGVTFGAAGLVIGWLGCSAVTFAREMRRDRFLLSSVARRDFTIERI
jgi:hypothetical protein